MARELNRQTDEGAGLLLRDALSEGVTPQYLVQLCAKYSTLVQRGRDHPGEYLAEPVGKSASTIKGHLWQAKKKGLFVGNAGRVGGELTPEGHRIYEAVIMEALKESKRRRSSES